MINTLILRNANNSCQRIDGGVLNEGNHPYVAETTPDEETTTTVSDIDISSHDTPYETASIFDFKDNGALNNLNKLANDYDDISTGSISFGNTKIIILTSNEPHSTNIITRRSN